MNKQKKAVIIGAGPAGLTASYEFLQHTDIQPVLLEADDMVGGISRTVNVRGNRMDMGGHRFFSKNDAIMEWWNTILPTQGFSSSDQSLHTDLSDFFQKDGPNPEAEDEVMLVRPRVSHIFYLQRFFDYPVSLSLRTITQMGILRSGWALLGFLYSSCFKRDENSLEDFYINRFGKPLYQMFFENYTEKVWGVHPRDFNANWGKQRVKGLSLLVVIKEMIKKVFSSSLSQKEVETSLIDHFLYPKWGPGQLWETVSSKIVAAGGTVNLNQKVTGIHILNNHVISVEVESPDSVAQTYTCDYLLSSMPVKELIAAIKGMDVPEDVREIASALPYRDFMTVGLLVRDLDIQQRKAIQLHNRRLPDTWIYIQDPHFQLGRIQFFNNWSPYMVKDYDHTQFLGLEFFCTEGDEMWSMTDEQFIEKAIQEMVNMHFIKKSDVLDAERIKVKKAYPAYYGSFDHFDRVKQFLDSVDNLFCIGRNGQHRYNNMDHSMLSAMEAVKNIKSNRSDKSNIWSVNTEQEYHEEKYSKENHPKE